MGTEIIITSIKTTGVTATTREEASSTRVKGEVAEAAGEASTRTTAMLNNLIISNQTRARKECSNQASKTANRFNSKFFSNCLRWISLSSNNTREKKRESSLETASTPSSTQLWAKKSPPSSLECFLTRVQELI